MLARRRTTRSVQVANSYICLFSLSRACNHSLGFIDFCIPSTKALTDAECAETTESRIPPCRITSGALIFLQIRQNVNEIRTRNNFWLIYWNWKTYLFPKIRKEQLESAKFRRKRCWSFYNLCSPMCRLFGLYLFHAEVRLDRASNISASTFAPNWLISCKWKSCFNWSRDEF